MAKKAICEQCGKSASLEEAWGSCPAGWVELVIKERGPDQRAEFCGLACAGRWATSQAESAAAADAQGKVL